MQKLSIAMIFALLTACGGGGVGDVQEPPTASLAALQQRASHATCGYEHVYITVQALRLRTAGNLGSRWSDMALALPRQIDLLDLTTVGLLEALGLPPMPLGQYAEVRLVLAPETGAGDTMLHAAQPTGGALTRLGVPGASRSGLRLEGAIGGAAGQQLDLALDGFDACTSIVQTGDSYLLKPSLGVKVRDAAPSATPVTPGGLVGSSNAGAGLATTMSSTITIQKAPDQPTTYFWAQQFFVDATIDHNGYFGLQTGGSTNGELMGKMVIFSMWNATAAIAGPTAVAVPFGGEGEGYSVRASFDWQENVPYTFTLSKADAMWWQLTVTSPGAEPLYLGRIQITQDVRLEATGASFTEYFTEIAGCQALPHARAAFSDLYFDGRLTPATQADAYGPCASHATGTVVAGTAIHEAGIAQETTR